jgi:hypothetical protein
MLMARFNLLQFRALFLRQIGRDFSMRSQNRFVDATTRVLSYFFELRGRSVDDRRYLGHLFRRQFQLDPKSFSHSFGDQSGSVPFQERMPRVQRRQESARHAPGDEDEDETGNQFPL